MSWAEFFGLLVVVDCLVTLINLCILGLTLKLYTEFYKVQRLTPKENK